LNEKKKILIQWFPNSWP